MRIAYFMDTPRLGGAERFLVDLAAGANAAGHRVVVISPQRFLLDQVKLAAPGVQMIKAGRVDYFHAPPGLATIAALLRAAPELRLAIARCRADILHVNNGGYPGSDLCRLATVVARLAGRPKCVLSVHNPAWARETSQPQLQAVVDHAVWRSVDAVHATSRFVGETLPELRGMPRTLCRNIRYGVAAPGGTAESVSKLRARLAPPGTKVLVGIVAATGEPHKGHTVLIEALARANVDFGLVIVGQHPGLPFVEQIDKLGLKNRVALEGPVAPDAVGPYLRAIDLLVVPSTGYESMPFVILEAMAAGKPVFASRLSGIPEAVIDGETGRLFTPGAVDELATLLRQAHRDPDALRQMGRAGNDRWRAKFSLPTMTASMLSLYEELVSDNAPSPSS